MRDITKEEAGHQNITFLTCWADTGVWAHVCRLIIPPELNRTSLPDADNARCPPSSPHKGLSFWNLEYWGTEQRNAFCGQPNSRRLRGARGWAMHTELVSLPFESGDLHCLYWEEQGVGSKAGMLREIYPSGIKRRGRVVPSLTWSMPPLK